MASNKPVQFDSFDHLKLHAKIYTSASTFEKSAGILIIEGSGKSGFTTEPATSPFVQLAEALAAKGYTVLTYNKRGSGENSSNGSFWKATFTSGNEG